MTTVMNREFRKPRKQGEDEQIVHSTDCSCPVGGQAPIRGGRGSQGCVGCLRQRNGHLSRGGGRGRQRDHLPTMKSPTAGHIYRGGSEILHGCLNLSSRMSSSCGDVGGAHGDVF